jgi:hypothetical protein
MVLDNKIINDQIALLVEQQYQHNSFSALSTIAGTCVRIAPIVRL